MTSRLDVATREVNIAFGHPRSVLNADPAAQPEVVLAYLGASSTTVPIRRVYLARLMIMGDDLEDVGRGYIESDGCPDRLGGFPDFPFRSSVHPVRR